MPNILFDLTACQPSRSSKRHGGGRYAEVVFLRMLERRIPLCCYYDSSRWINPNIMESIATYCIKLYDIQNCDISTIIEESHANIIYSALPLNLLDYIKAPCRLLFTWHGLREEELPMDDYFWKYRNKSWRETIRFILKRYFPKLGLRKKMEEHRKSILNNQAEFVMVSNHSLYSLMCYYPEIKGRDIKVFYSPSTSSKKEISQKKYADSYFLIVSANRWSKNALRAVIALDRLFSTGYLKGYSVRITGVKDASAYKYKLLNPERFEFMGYVDDDELEQLYHDAYALIYPSLNEGFGYPPIEAMHYGIPVLASAITSIPEICGDAAIYFNPFSVEEIMSRILWVVKSEVRQEYSIKALERHRIIALKQENDLDALIDYMVAFAELR